MNRYVAMPPQRAIALTSVVSLLLIALAATSDAARCPTDSVRSGVGCIDVFEASVWRIPNPTTTNLSLVKRLQKGKVTAALMIASGAVQLGVGSDDLAPCSDVGAGCDDVFAASIRGVLPSAYVTWFQAAQACANAGKRLPTSAEWYVAATGTPDPGPDDGSTDCNTNSALAAVPTGSRSSCVSSRGVFDAVGNLAEWAADSVPVSQGCPGGGGLTDDLMCFSGASTTTTSPGALLRGGRYGDGVRAGPLAVDAPAAVFFGSDIGFRCTR